MQLVFTWWSFRQCPIWWCGRSSSTGKWRPRNGRCPGIVLSRWTPPCWLRPAGLSSSRWGKQWACVQDEKTFDTVGLTTACFSLVQSVRRSDEATCGTSGWCTGWRWESLWTDLKWWGLLSRVLLPRRSQRCLVSPWKNNSVSAVVLLHHLTVKKRRLIWLLGGGKESLM